MKLEVKLMKKYRPSSSIDFWKHVTNFILSSSELHAYLSETLTFECSKHLLSSKALYSGIIYYWIHKNQVK